MIIHPSRRIDERFLPARNQTDGLRIGKADDFEIASLSKIAARMSCAHPLHDVLAEVIEFITSVLTCDSCMIYVLENKELVLSASNNPHPESIDRLKMKVGQGITGWVAAHREPVFVTKRAYEDSRFKPFNELPEDRFEAFLSVPVVSGARIVGVINIQNRAPHQHSNREIGLIATLGFLVGAEIERARLENENLYLSDKLESRKVVERAKGILQRDLNLNEEGAYLTLRTESQQRRKSIKEVAEAILLSEDLKRQKQMISENGPGLKSQPSRNPKL